MHKTFVFVIILFGFNVSVLKTDNVSDKSTSPYYIAAAVEYSPVEDAKMSSTQMVDLNLKAYLKIIKKAKLEEADILVFPEATLNYNSMRSTRKTLLIDAIEIPESGEVNLNDRSKDDVLGQLSKTVREHGMYVLVNLVEKVSCLQHKPEDCAADGHLLYNTNIVFDRNGKIISRYRKYNLFVEPHINVTAEPDITTFDTDFGVTFGHFICFDILFKEPAIRLVQKGVKHFVYATMWFSELPLYTASQIQLNWANANNVVLIASGANVPTTGTTGSGIYFGNGDNSKYIMSPKNITQLIVAKVPKINYNTDSKDIDASTVELLPRFSSKEMDELNLLPFELPYTTGLTKDLQRVCKGKVCCEFDLKYEELSVPSGKVGYSYRLTAFQGIRAYAQLMNAGILFCAIVACSGANGISCGQRYNDNTNLVDSTKFVKISIRAVVEIESEDEDYLIMPSSIDTSILPFTNIIFEQSEVYKKESKLYKNYTIISSQPISNMLTFGINGRLFHLDSPYSTTQNKTLFEMLSTNVLVWTIAVLIFSVCYMKM